MTEPETIGSYLRAVRKRRRISIERAAEETRIRATFLMRLESDEFDFLAPAYVRGFLRSYARFLRVDPDPLVKEFDRSRGSSRVDTGQIAALQRRRRAVREPRRWNRWVVAGAGASFVLLGLGLIGLASGPEGGDAPRRVGAETSPATETEPRAPAHARPSDRPGEIAFADGIELEIVASTGDCWVLIASDGGRPVTETIALGDSRTYHADRELFVRLGFPEGVELIVNGTNIGSPGGRNPINLTFPDDIKSLI